MAFATATASAQKDDPISGKWDVTFTIQGQTATGTFDLKLDNNVVTGTVYTAHTGDGTLSKGKWADNKLSFTLNFAKHESIDVIGGVQNSVLQGEFATEGMTGTWIAKKE